MQIDSQTRMMLARCTRHALAVSVVAFLHLMGAMVAHPAAQPNNQDASRVFSSDAGLIFTQVDPDKASDFDGIIRKMRVALQLSTDAVRKRQAAGWKAFKSSVPATNGSILYVFVMDPVVKSADYSVSRVLAEGFPADVKNLYTQYLGSLAVPGESIINLQQIRAFAVDPVRPGAVRLERNSQQPPFLLQATLRSRAAFVAMPSLASMKQTAVAPGSSFNGDAAMIFHTIKPERTIDFEMVNSRLAEALRNSTDAVKNQMAAGWKLFKSVEAGPSGSVLYISILDPVVKTADYTVSNILADAFPGEVQSLYQKYSDAYAAAQTPVNLQLIAAFGGGEGLALPIVR